MSIVYCVCSEAYFALLIEIASHYGNQVQFFLACGFIDKYDRDHCELRAEFDLMTLHLVQQTNHLTKWVTDFPCCRPMSTAYCPEVQLMNFTWRAYISIQIITFDYILGFWNDRRRYECGTQGEFFFGCLPLRCCFVITTIWPAWFQGIFSGSKR